MRICLYSVAPNHSAGYAYTVCCQWRYVYTGWRLTILQGIFVQGGAKEDMFTQGGAKNSLLHRVAPNRCEGWRQWRNVYTGWRQRLYIYTGWRLTIVHSGANENMFKKVWRLTKVYNTVCCQWRYVYTGWRLTIVQGIFYRMASSKTYSHSVASRMLCLHRVAPNYCVGYFCTVG